MVSLPLAPPGKSTVVFISRFLNIYVSVCVYRYMWIHVSTHICNVWKSTSVVIFLSCQFRSLCSSKTQPLHFFMQSSHQKEQWNHEKAQLALVTSFPISSQGLLLLLMLKVLSQPEPDGHAIQGSQTTGRCVLDDLQTLGLQKPFPYQSIISHFHK